MNGTGSNCDVRGAWLAAALVAVALLLSTRPADAQLRSRTSGLRTLDRPAISAVEPRALALAPDGSEAEVRISGTALEGFDRGVVEVKGRASRDFRVDVRYDRRRREMLVSIAASPASAGLRGELVLYMDRERLPVGELAVTVLDEKLESPRLSRLTADPLSVEGGDPMEILVELDRPAARGGTEILLEVSGEPKQRVIRVPDGSRSVAIEMVSGVVESEDIIRVRASLDGVVLETEVVVTTSVFEPRSASASSLRFTGVRFVPLAASTSALAFSGAQFVPGTANAATLLFQGVRFEPLSTNTSTILFSGTRGTSR